MNKFLIGLAPMDGWTDSPFRRICCSLGADFVFSEMIPAAGIVHYYNKGVAFDQVPTRLRKLLDFTAEERPIVLQIFGKDPAVIAEAYQILGSGWTQIPDEININFGCPARSAVRSGHGVALMDNPELAKDIVQHCNKVKKNFGLRLPPITIKMRTGWSSPDEAVPFAQKMEQSGAQAIYIHGRTFKQKFNGEADWSTIERVAKSVKIPVFGNGDIDSNEKLKIKKEQYQGILAGALVGRGARGNPWIFHQDTPKCILIKNDLPKIVLRHAQLAWEFKGEQGIIELRKHLCCYFTGIPNASSWRKKLQGVSTVEEIEQILKSI